MIGPEVLALEGGEILLFEIKNWLVEVVVVVAFEEGAVEPKLADVVDDNVFFRGGRSEPVVFLLPLGLWQEPCNEGFLHLELIIFEEVLDVVVLLREILHDLVYILLSHIL